MIDTLEYMKVSPVNKMDANEFKTLYEFIQNKFNCFKKALKDQGYPALETIQYCKEITMFMQ